MKKKLTALNNILCAVLLIATFASMFVPCWNFTAEEKLKMKTCRECGLEVVLEGDEADLPEDYACPGKDGVPCGATGKKSFKSSTTKKTYEDTASVMGFTWLAFDNTGLTAKFEAEGAAINDIILAPFLLTLCTIAGVVACLLNMNGTWQSLFPLAGGVITVWAYLTKPVFQVGSWVLTVALAAALAVAGLALFVQLVIKIVKWFVVPVPRR